MDEGVSLATITFRSLTPRRDKFKLSQPGAGAACGVAAPQALVICRLGDYYHSAPSMSKEDRDALPQRRPRRTA
jgi:hypothetical protein